MIRHNLASSQKPSRVVILGGSGFIGKNLSGHLAAAGVKVYAVSSAEADLCAPTAPETLARLIEKGDALVLASAITPDKGRDSRTQLRNFTMAQSVCDFLEKNPGVLSHLVYLSSDAVYDDLLSLARESSPASPPTFYGLMHLGRERMLSDALKRSEMPLLTLRLSILYGAKDTHKSYGPNRFFKTAFGEGKIALFGNGEEKRDHVFIEDVSRLIGRCLERRSRGLLNVATGRSVSFMEAAQAIRKLFGEKVRIETTPRANPITHRHYDTAELLGSFPDFRFTPLEEGLERTFKEIRNSH